MASNYQGCHILMTSDLYALPLAGLLENGIFPTGPNLLLPGTNGKPSTRKFLRT